MAESVPDILPRRVVMFPSAVDKVKRAVVMDKNGVDLAKSGGGMRQGGVVRPRKGGRQFPPGHLPLVADLDIGDNLGRSPVLGTTP